MKNLTGDLVVTCDKIKYTLDSVWENSNDQTVT